jgi:hypothetical protein
MILDQGGRTNKGQEGHHEKYGGKFGRDARQMCFGLRARYTEQRSVTREPLVLSWLKLSIALTVYAHTNS